MQLHAPLRSTSTSPCHIRPESVTVLDTGSPIRPGQASALPRPGRPNSGYPTKWRNCPSHSTPNSPASSERRQLSTRATSCVPTNGVVTDVPPTFRRHRRRESGEKSLLVLRDHRLHRSATSPTHGVPQVACRHGRSRIGLLPRPGNCLVPTEGRAFYKPEPSRPTGGVTAGEPLRGPPGYCLERRHPAARAPDSSAMYAFEYRR